MKKHKNTNTKIEEDDRCLARAQLHPAFSATETIIGQNNSLYGIKREALFKELREQAAQIKKGNLDRIEEMHIMQAHTLDGMFADMLHLGRKILPNNSNAAEKIIRLALKAQSQCRSSLEALAELKNPKPYIQNNRANYQQVNNNVEQSCTHEKNNLRNELLEEENDAEWMDIKTPAETGTGNQKMETVGKKHWS